VDYFKNLKDYREYFYHNKLDKLFDIDDLDKRTYNKKIKKNDYDSIDPKNQTPYPIEIDDLIRLHYLIRTRKVITVLEFGVGKSTVIFDNALEQNKIEYQDKVKKDLRVLNAFECHSLDNNKDWIENTKKEFPKLKNVTFNYSECEMNLFMSKICCSYKKLPSILPDFIYIDAPDQHSIKGSVNGISTKNSDLPVMSSDVLLIENFLMPGTLVVVDGRGANSQFLKNNLQRNWIYNYNEEYDQHFFELCEKPIGIFNYRKIDFCLGKKWISNLI